MQVGNWQRQPVFNDVMNNYPASSGSQRIAGQVLKKEFDAKSVVQMVQNMAVHHAKN